MKLINQSYSTAQTTISKSAIKNNVQLCILKPKCKNYYYLKPSIKEKNIMSACSFGPSGFQTPWLDDHP